MGLSEMDALSPTLNRCLPSYLQSWERLHAILIADARHELQDYIRSSLESCGLAVQTLDHDRLGLIFYGEAATESKRTLFIHTDYDRQELTKQYAASIMACLAAFDIQFHRQKSPPMNICWLLSDKRMFSSQAFQQFVMERPALFQANGGLWFHREATLGAGMERPQLALGAKGLLSVACSVQTMQTELPSHYGTIVPNAAWRLIWALGSLKNKYEDILIDGFYDDILAHKDDMLDSLREQAPGISSEVRQEVLPGLQGPQISYVHYLTPTCTITFFRSSGSDEKEGKHADSAQRIVPDRARAQIDFHLVPDQRPEEIFTRLKRHMTQQGFADVVAQLNYASAPGYTEHNHPFIQAALRATEQAYEQAPILLPVVAKHLPLASLQQLSVPVVVAIPPATRKRQDEDLVSLIKQLLLTIDAIRE